MQLYRECDIRITIPINKVTELAKEMQVGRLSSTDVDYRFSDNEVGDFAKVLKQTKNSLHLVVNDASVILNDISNGIVDKKPEVEYPGDFETIKESIIKIDDNLIAALNEITEMTAEKEHIGAELGIATKIQADMLSKDFPKRDDVELFAAMTSAKEVGGDFYDFFFTDDDHLALVMADVAGKGISAALLCVITKVVLRNQVMTGGNPAEILSRVNKIVIANNAGLFVTVWLGILDLNTGVVEYCNAGHEYPIIGLHGDSVEVVEKENCAPLAAVEDAEFIDEKLTLDAGETLFLYTDGVSEAKSARGERFGMERLTELLNRQRGLSPKQIVTDVKWEVEAFQPDNDPFDDVTIMSIIWKGRSS